MTLKANENEIWESLETTSLHAGASPDPTTGAILTPIYQTTTYRQSAVGENKGFTYSRSSNPTVSALERRLAALEGAAHASCYSSGMAATTTLFLSLLKSGDHIVVTRAVYGGTVRILRQVLSQFGITADFVDTADLGALRSSLSQNKATRIVFIETPANPTLHLTDIQKGAELAHEADALLVVDNTLLSPALQQPIKLGADVVLHSTTKFIEGHNAAVGGALITQSAKLHERFEFIRGTLGTIQTPFNAWLTLQGVKTLPVRMSRHSENAHQVARFLQSHPRVVRLNYPGLETFPQYELAKKQQRNGGALISFEIEGGVETGIRLMNSVRLCSLAENLGAAETIITHPISMTHGSVPPEQRAEAGITDGLVRLSVGLESPQDIIADLDQALRTAFGEERS